MHLIGRKDGRDRPSFWERLLRSAIFLGTEDGFSGVCHGCFLKLRFVCEVKIVEIVWLREGNSTLREKTTDSTKNHVIQVMNLIFRV